MEAPTQRSYTIAIRKRSNMRDVNRTASSTVQAIASGQIPASIRTADGKAPLAVALGWRGGLKSGPAPASKMPASERSESAKNGGAIAVDEEERLNS